ncbi:ATP-dependent helicase HrpB [Allocatelliglobosispora scoriae]|uniref:ATP-dependent helicase HrpB n=1 Tax=Allocatelliglobosispora scoriae TaxID=643052 RepID=A0A841BMU4_9ACTN|nr:ATP-dependent helicase HrpB [Allocatelliglobosispora scoriae]MBB5868293.1 ATP-dependent helicase HrpB [Allocatelliglobosispora scoriae]
MLPEVDLPVRAALPELLAALRDTGTAVLVAPPGSGKTTLVPLALADQVEGRVIVAEPRRIAARAAASRMASLTGTRTGGLVGYTVRGDSRTSAETRVEVVTTGVLVQRLHRDPELPGVAAIVLDECHERHLDTDLALAFALDTRTHLRPDLMLLATSATAEAERLASVMGNGTSIVSAAGIAHPVEVVWAPPTGPVDAPYGLRVDPRLLDHVAAVIRRALTEGTGDILVFLPGAGEIGGVAGRLGGLRDVDVLSLHGRQGSSVQDDALRPGPRRRIVLATAVAESSLTVPGVRIVVDAGLARVPRTDHGRGLDALVTVRASRAAATQRAGRAGREAPGRVYRCWSERDHDRLPAFADPEIAGADLTAFVLHLACWGQTDGTGLALLDPLPAAAAQVARTTLTALGALDEAGRVTARGRAIAGVGAHPRLARALLDGAAIVGDRVAAEVVALLSADVRTSTDDLPAALRRLRDNADPAATAAWRTESRRLSGGMASHPSTGGWSGDLAAALIVGLAFPERIGRVRTAGGRVYLMTGGTAAELAQGTSLNGVEWIAIADADRQPGNAAARIRLAAPIDAETAKLAAEALYADGGEVTWTDGDVLARHRTRLGAIVLSDRPLAKPDPQLVAAALGEGLRRQGLKLLRWTPDATGVRERLAFLHHALGDPWPAVDDASLLADLGWLGPALATARNRKDLSRIDVAAALRRLLPWAQLAQLDEYAPDRIEVPSGSRIRVDYTDPAAPFLAVKVQEMFGSTQAPMLAGGRFPLALHLLSPAGRPAAVTADLESFWRNGYLSVRSELRGRYPNHPWPDNPMKAKPSGRTKPRP